MWVKYISARGTVIKVGEVEITILDLNGSTVRIGIDAPRSMRIEDDAFLRRPKRDAVDLEPARRGPREVPSADPLNEN